MRWILPAALIFAASILAFANRYSAGKLAPGVTWTLDRFTGEMTFCGVSGCVIPDRSVPAKIPPLPKGFNLDQKP